MLKSYIRIAWRSLLKDKLSTMLNLMGLSIGLAAAVLIFLWISDEWRVDTFHEKNSQLYQVMENQVNSNVIKTVEWTPAPLAEFMLREMPEVQEAATVMPSTFFPEAVLAVSAAATIKAKPQFASHDYFNIFSYKLVAGHKSKVLADKNAIVISTGLAKRLFNTAENIIGKTIHWQLLQWKGQAVVSGVFENVPAHSTQQFDMVLPFETFMELLPRFKNNWEANSPSTYLVLKQHTDIARFNQKIAGFVQSKNKNSHVTLFVRKYADQYLYGRYQDGKQSGGRIGYVRLFTVIAFFILAIACVNFMNLSTAKASGSMKELGVKKALGASRKQLVFQYLGASVLLSMLSLLLALVLVFLCMPLFNRVTGKSMALVFDVHFMVACLGIGLATGVVAGSYPALYLSACKPMAVLSGRIKNATGELLTRKGLVVFQFILSVVMIVSVLVVYQQMAFVQSKDLGYNKDNVIFFQAEGKATENINTVIAEIKNIPGILDASSTTHSFTGSFMTRRNLNWPGKRPGDEISFENMEVNYGLIETLGMQVAEGRSFSKAFGSEVDKIILNEAAVAAMGLTDPVGKTIEIGDDKKEIIGVIRNFHFESLHQNIKPLLFVLNDREARIMVAKIKAGSGQSVITHLQQFYKGFNPGYSFDYTFLDANYQQLYEAEQKVSLLSRYFAALAILVSCLGLFGLVAFTAQKRQKEIGIRKVIGATVGSVTMMLSTDFLKLVLLAMLIAFPLSWLLMNQWLQGFAYHIHIGMDVFVLAGVCTMLISLLTVGFQAIKAATANPVKSLRTE
jgi:putative ABC transport system permease protein